MPTHAHPHTLAVSAVGLDCEWRPSAYGGTGTLDSNPLGGSEDHPVATLQLAFREEIFIIDMLTISGVVTYKSYEKNNGNGINKTIIESSGSSSSDEISLKESNTRETNGSDLLSSSVPMEEKHTKTLTEAEGALCAALGELFAHQKIAILGL